MSSDQQSHWNNIHGAGSLRSRSEKISSLAEETLKIIKPNGDLLDLGCGAGNDSAFFAANGQKVIATDFSEATVNDNQQLFTDVPNLTFQILDTNNIDQLPDNSFDTVYARLSLHYFTDEQTKRIFALIRDKLKEGGKLIFICKSVDDPLYKQGELIEENMYSLNGHIRHFFSEDYARECLGDMFNEIEISSHREDLYGHPSAYIKVIAERK